MDLNYVILHKTLDDLVRPDYTHIFPGEYKLITWTIDFSFILDYCMLLSGFNESVSTLMHYIHEAMYIF